MILVTVTKNGVKVNDNPILAQFHSLTLQLEKSIDDGFGNTLDCVGVNDDRLTRTGDGTYTLELITPNPNSKPKFVCITRFDQFRDAYIAELTDRYANDPNYAYAKTKTTPTEYADKVINSILFGADRTGDFFKSNPAIKVVAKQLGYKTTKAVRQLLATNQELFIEHNQEKFPA